MIIKKIALSGWRNYEWETVEFSPGTHVIAGQNAQGKTNLLEAVYILACGKSFRTRFDRELIGFDFSEADILADVFSHGRDQTVNIRLRNGLPKRILVNGVKKTAGELAETFNVVLFCPDDLNIIKEGDKTRILKDWREKPALLDTLDEFSDGICRTSAQLIRYRAAFTERLKTEAAPIHSDFSGSGEKLEIFYSTISTVTDPTAPVKDIYYEICDHQEKHRQAEIDSAQCLTGAHKDDLEIRINGKNARNFASQGQTRTAALSIKLAEREIFLSETGEYPVLLLDDVLSELDEKRQTFVLNSIGGGQTLISCCEDADISSRTGGRVLMVSEGRIR